MGSHVVAHLLVHDALKHGAEDSGRDVLPVKMAGIYQRLAHFGIKAGLRQGFGKEAPVDIFKLKELR